MCVSFALVPPPFDAPAPPPDVRARVHGRVPRAAGPPGPRLPRRPHRPPPGPRLGPPSDPGALGRDDQGGGKGQGSLGRFLGVPPLLTPPLFNAQLANATAPVDFPPSSPSFRGALTAS